MQLPDVQASVFGLTLQQGLLACPCGLAGASVAGKHAHVYAMADRHLGHAQTHEARIKDPQCGVGRCSVTVEDHGLLEWRTAHPGGIGGYAGVFIAKGNAEHQAVVFGHA